MLSSPFPYALPLPLVPTYEQDLFYLLVLYFGIFNFRRARLLYVR
jgi:hypothetical protein